MTREKYNKIFQEQLKKDSRMAELDKWFKEHSGCGYYFHYNENTNEFMVGNAYGPMNSYRYKTIDEFYKNYYKFYQ